VEVQVLSSALPPKVRPPLRGDHDDFRRFVLEARRERAGTCEARACGVSAGDILGLCFDRTVARLYAALCVLGAALPLWFFGSFLVDEGLDVGAFFDQLTESDIALFAWADVAVAGLVVIVFAARERVERWWLAVLGTVLVGPSFGLPLLLFLRERERMFDAVRVPR
jgi:hypothetical protein